MTAELRQAIEMLTLNALEVQDLVSKEAAENPLLEVEAAESDTAQTAAGAEDDHGEGNWENSWDSWAVRDEGASGPLGGSLSSGTSSYNSSEDGPSWETTATKSESLRDYVGKQYEELVTDPKLRLIGKFLIDALDDDGYLRLNLEEASKKLGVSEDMVDDARALLQSLHPAGIGATTLQECLRLQLHASGLLDPVTDICLNHLDLVAKKDFAKLAKLASCTEDQVALGLSDIQTCNPKPGLAFGERRVEVVIPEVIVEKQGDTWKVMLNGAAFPKLGISNLAGLLAGDRSGEGKKYLNEKQTRAKWLMNALEQRAQTIDKVAKAIVAAQTLFFEAGSEFLQPLTLRQIADQVGVHESTVSRVTSGKFMQTPRGVLEFKYFFASGVGSTGGNVDVAATSVQAMISRLIKAEDPEKPLSDEKILLLLKDEGVDVARRTVAKYRGILGIPGTSDRRVR